jgi:putative SOS response-associated peptidase YedK
MCGRYQASSSPAELARWFKTTGPGPNLQQRYNAAPTQDLPVVCATRQRRRIIWGLKEDGHDGGYQEPAAAAANVDA